MKLDEWTFHGQATESKVLSALVSEGARHEGKHYLLRSECVSPCAKGKRKP